MYMRPTAGRASSLNIQPIHSTSPKQIGTYNFSRAQHNFFVNKNTNQKSKCQDASSFGKEKKQHIAPPLPEQDSEEQKTTNIQFNNEKLQSNISRKPLPDFNTPSFDSDKEIETFLNKAASLPLHEALDVFCKHHFGAKEAYVWQEVPNLQLLYCHSTKATAAHSSGLVGYAFFSRSVVRSPDGPSHPSYIPNIDEPYCPFKAPILLFPLYDYKSNIAYVIEVVRQVNGTEFTSLDIEFTDWFIKRFKILSRWLKPSPPIDSLFLEFMPVVSTNDFLKTYQEKISTFFDCRTVEFWTYDKSTTELTQYTDHIEKIHVAKAGIVGEAIIHEKSINCVLNRLHSHYNSDIDGNQDESILAFSYLGDSDNLVYCIVLRGPKTAKIFTNDDEESVRRFSPVIQIAFSNCAQFAKVESELIDSQHEREGLHALLEVVEDISSQLDTIKLTEIIMEKGRLLTDSDRCSLFLVNETRDRLITSLHQGLDNAIDIPINKGIAGKTVTEARILNIPDVYETDFFDSSTDIETGYRTRSILSVPIYNNRGEIIGVTEMVNKKDDKIFSQWDQKLIQIYNVFCGISLENARLYQGSVEMSKQLRNFFDISTTLNKSDNAQKKISVIMQKAKNTIGAERASLFILDEGAECLSTFISDCDKMPNTLSLHNGICSTSALSKEGLIVNDPYHNAKFNRAIDNITGFKTRSVLACPILRSDGSVLGVVEMLNKRKQNGDADDQTTTDFVSKDLQTVKAFGQFAAITLENSRLKDMAQYGDCEIELSKWIGESERKCYDTPKNLRLTDDQIAQVSRLNCFAVDFKGIGHFKEQFYFFSLFDLLRTYKITNDVFFRFIFTISGLYNDVPYHNWTHACDVTQYVCYEIKTAKLDELYTKFELFGLLTSAVCHDTNHEGFNNVFNVKAETPFGILFKDQSVMEMHHITVSIPVLTNDDINLFHSLTSDEIKKMWNLFIKLILATDMANHFELVKRCTALLDENKLNFEDSEHRLLSMQLLLKVGDISNVSRPFELADKWCDILNNEFFRQGDLEKQTGIGLTSPLNDRDHSDKPKSQIGFYNFICLPLYNVVAKMFPPLSVNVDSLKSNLETWKGLAAQNAPPPEEKK